MAYAQRRHLAGHWGWASRIASMRCGRNKHILNGNCRHILGNVGGPRPERETIRVAAIHPRPPPATGKGKGPAER